MGWAEISARVEIWGKRSAAWRKRTRTIRRRIAIFLAVVGPGLITSNVDNDAGGIYTYSLAGARFGFRVTFFVMAAVLVVNLGNVLAEFAGVASAMEIFGVSKYISVPIAAFLVWVLVVRGTASRVEKIFLIVCTVYFTYIVSAFLARPDWLAAAKNVVVPVVRFDPAYLLMLAALVGTTIAPWQHFYLQAAVVEKRVGPRQYSHLRKDVLVGSISCMVVVFFIIVCTAATLNHAGHTNISSAAEAAQALKPLARGWAEALFAFGLLNASLFAASILPLSTAYVICEALGFESGIDRKLGEAPIFYSLYTALIIIGGGLILIPRAPLLRIAVLSQVANGFLLPFVLIFILLLVNRRDLMGDQVNNRTFNAVAWTTSVGMIVLTLVLLYVVLFRPGQAVGLG